MTNQAIPRTPRYITRTLISGRPKRSAIITASLCVFFIYLCSLIFWKNIGEISGLLPGNSEAIFNNKEYWRLISGLFIHGDLKHFLSNAMMFFVFAIFLNSYFGFFVFPVCTFILGVVTNYISLLTYPPEVNLIGASGIVYVMSGIWLSLFLFIDRRHSFVGRLIRVTAFTLLVLFPSTYEPTTSYRTHAIGFILGCAFGVIYFIFNKSKIRSKEELNVKKFLEDISEIDDTEKEV